MNKDLEHERAVYASGDATTGSGAIQGESACPVTAAHAARSASPVSPFEQEEAEALDFIAQMVDKGELDPIDGIDLCLSRKY